MKNNNEHQCDFCGKSKEDVEKLIVSENSAICNDCVELCVDILKDEKVKKNPAEQLKQVFNPVKIKDYLDEYIIGQDEAKIALSVGVCQHFKRINFPPDNLELEKTNILLLGPTGCGKTFLARKLADYLDLPFAICDATGLTEAGYVGDDVESVLTRLLANSDYDVEKAQKGIIYIDEIDKIARKGESTSITRDVSGEGVQQGLLKMIEGSICRVPIDKRKHPKGDIIEIDTSKILFICGGAFVGLDKIIQKRKTSNTIGFTTSVMSQEMVSTYFNEVTTKDLVTFGMIPEFVGRFGIITNVEELTEPQLVKILVEPKNSLIKQYQYLFELDGIELMFESSAYSLVAKKAKELKTNARGLKNILEKVLLPYQFDSIDLVERGLYKIVISKESIEGSAAKLIFNKENEQKQS